LDSWIVQKTGRTTEHTVGYVSAIDWKGTVLYDWTPGYFEKQIVVETYSPGKPVALGGDSGSLVCTMDNKACGLLFAGPASGDHFIANHIDEVFNRLNVKLCCVPAESVEGAENQNVLPELRKLREKIRLEKKLSKYVNLYGKHSGKFFQEIIRDHKLKKLAGQLTSVLGELNRNSDLKMDSAATKLGQKIIDIVIKKHKEDRVFLRDMKLVKNIVEKSEGKTLIEILTMLKKK